MGKSMRARIPTACLQPSMCKPCTLYLEDWVSKELVHFGQTVPPSREVQQRIAPLFCRVCACPTACFGPRDCAPRMKFCLFGMFWQNMSNLRWTASTLHVSSRHVDVLACTHGVLSAPCLVHAHRCTLACQCVLDTFASCAPKQEAAVWKDANPSDSEHAHPCFLWSISSSCVYSPVSCPIQYEVPHAALRQPTRSTLRWIVRVFASSLFRFLSSQ